MTIQKIESVAETVRDILELYPKTRDDDNILYYKVLKIHGDINGIDINIMSVASFLFHMKEYGFPPFETVRRARQKIQHDHPDLASSKYIQKIRKQEEDVYYNYSLKEESRGIQ